MLSWDSPSTKGFFLLSSPPPAAQGCQATHARFLPCTHNPGPGAGLPHTQPTAARQQQRAGHRWPGARARAGYNVDATVPMAVARRAGVLVGLSRSIARGLSAAHPRGLSLEFRGSGCVDQASAVATEPSRRTSDRFRAREFRHECGALNLPPGKATQNLCKQLKSLRVPKNRKFQAGTHKRTEIFFCCRRWPRPLWENGSNRGSIS